MKMRRHRVFLICTVGLCVISFLHYYKALHYVSLLRELSAPYPNIKSFIMVTGFFWKEGSTLFPVYHHPKNPLESLGGLHRRTHVLQDDRSPYFVRTKAGALCFHETLKRGKRLVKCVCRPGWHGPYCGVPTMVYHSNLPTKERLTPRETPRRVINAINVNHEFDLLHVRFRELIRAVDLFLVCESNFTAYGERRPLRFLHMLLNGTYDYVRHKILYVFLDHFPEGGRQDGWIADDYLRTFLTRDGMARIAGSRPDDVFLINDADEIPAQEGILFLKLFDGWTEPFAIHMRKSLYGFFWKQLGSLEVVSGCTVGMLRDVYDNDGIRLRRREYYTMPGFRKYENDTGHILVQWSIGSPFHFAGWHCSWCFTPEGIHFKLISAQNGDFPRWGDYEDKRDLSYIRELIRTGGWFDGSVQEYPPSDSKEHMYAPKYMLDNYDHYRYLLENPYAKQSNLGGA
uniref:Beta-1,4-mannosyl-glycoprotein 4-beta-N-acetylglucosaminyltransferase-like n=1 Tax=Sinocyclocheilus rhinocerous TaxID=307959 RepID=A0A673GSI0_9TELE